MLFSINPVPYSRIRICITWIKFSFWFWNRQLFHLSENQVNWPICIQFYIDAAPMAQWRLIVQQPIRERDLSTMKNLTAFRWLQHQTQTVVLTDQVPFFVHLEFDCWTFSSKLFLFLESNRVHHSKLWYITTPYLDWCSTKSTLPYLEIWIWP